MQYKNTYIILALLIATMGSFVVSNVLSNFSRFLEYMGFIGGNSGTFLSWGLALIVVVLYCHSAASISDVRRYMFKLDSLKMLAIVAAVCAGIVEEIVFRKWLMDFLHLNGYPIAIQILCSGVLFGLLHLLWGIKNFKAGINAAISTTILGLALAVIYWLGDRSLAPCITAHFLITALIEPGLLIAVQNDRLGYWRENTRQSEIS